MSWSKVNPGKKPLGWWYHKIMCEIGYAIGGSTNWMYHNNLKAIVNKYKINLYGEHI